MRVAERLFAMLIAAVSGERGLRWQGSTTNKLVFALYLAGGMAVFPAISVCAIGFPEGPVNCDIMRALVRENAHMAPTPCSKRSLPRHRVRPRSRYAHRWRARRPEHRGGMLDVAASIVWPAASNSADANAA